MQKLNNLPNATASLRGADETEASALLTILLQALKLVPLQIQPVALSRKTEVIFDALFSLTMHT